MSSIIKTDTLGRIKGEYIIDPGKVSKTRTEHARVNRTASPEDQAKSIVEQARKEAETIILAAREEAEGIKASAYQEGYETGYKETEEVRAALADRLAQAEEDVNKQLDEFWASLEPEVLKLGVEIARRIVQHEISEDQEFVLDTVKTGLHQLRDRQDLRLHVNPADYEFVRERREEIMSSCDGMRGLEIVDDRRVDQGGCLIESDNGHLDARIETQLNEVERALLVAAHDGKNDLPELG